MEALYGGHLQTCREMGVGTYASMIEILSPMRYNPLFNHQLNWSGCIPGGNRGLPNMAATGMCADRRGHLLRFVSHICNECKSIGLSITFFQGNLEDEIHCQWKVCLGLYWYPIQTIISAVNLDSWIGFLNRKGMSAATEREIESGYVVRSKGDKITFNASDLSRFTMSPKIFPKQFRRDNKFGRVVWGRWWASSHLQIRHTYDSSPTLNHHNVWILRYRNRQGLYAYDIFYIFKVTALQG